MHVIHRQLVNGKVGSIRLSDLTKSRVLQYSTRKITENCREITVKSLASPLYPSKTRNPLATLRSKRCYSQIAHDPLETGMVTTGPLSHYRAKVAMGELRYDEQQMRAVLKLQQLYESLLDYDPPVELLDNPLDLSHFTSTSGLLNENGNVWSTVSPNSSASSLQAPQQSEELEVEEDLFEVPKGIWLCGEVGTGKTLLSDLFFDTMPAARKQRVHFHEFMQDVYRKIHQFNQVQWSHSSNLHLRAESLPGERDNRHVLQAIARDLVARSWLIVFDEFQVTDIATAALLKELLGHVTRMGGVLVATSNRSPDDLYRGGYQRVMFAEFMEMLSNRCEVHDMRSTVDYRKAMAQSSDEQYYFEAKDVAGFEKLVSEIKPPEWKSKELKVNHRIVKVPRQSNGIAYFTFSELCQSNYGPADYLELAKEFHTIILESIPQMGLLMKDQARRLITLIDACYENKVKLVVLAACAPEELFLIKPLLQNTPTVIAPLPDHYGTVAYDYNIQRTSSVPEPEPDIDIMQREVIGAAISISSRDRAYRNMWGAPKSDAEQLQEMKDLDKLAIFTAEDEIFAFRRASSRLREMGWSSTYREESGPQRIIRSQLDGSLNSTIPPPSLSTSQRPKVNLDEEARQDDWGDEASYAGYLKQYKRFNQKPNETEEAFAERILNDTNSRPKLQKLTDWHFFGMQTDEDAWSVKTFFRQLRRRYEPPKTSKSSK